MEKSYRPERKGCAEKRKIFGLLPLCGLLLAQKQVEHAQVSVRGKITFMECNGSLEVRLRSFIPALLEERSSHSVLGTEALRRDAESRLPKAVGIPEVRNIPRRKAREAAYQENKDKNPQDSERGKMIEAAKRKGQEEEEARHG